MFLTRFVDNQLIEVHPSAKFVDDLSSVLIFTEPKPVTVDFEKIVFSYKEEDLDLIDLLDITNTEFEKLEKMKEQIKNWINTTCELDSTKINDIDKLMNQLSSLLAVVC